MKWSLQIFHCLAIGAVSALTYPAAAHASLLYLDDGVNISSYPACLPPSSCTAPVSPTPFSSNNVGNGVLSMLFTLNDVLLTAPSGGSQINAYSPAGGVPTTFNNVITDPIVNPYGLAMDGQGDVYVGAGGGTSIEELSRTGAELVPNLASGANVQVESLAVNASGVLFEADDYSADVINEVTSGGVTTFATLGNGENYSMAFDSAGDLFVTFSTGFGSGGIYKITTGGAISTFYTASTTLPDSLALDSETGDLYLAFQNSSGGGIGYFSPASLEMSTVLASALVPFASDLTVGSDPFALAVLTPEPGSLLLLAGGLLAIFLLRLRRAGLLSQ